MHLTTTEVTLSVIYNILQFSLQNILTQVLNRHMHIEPQWRCNNEQFSNDYIVSLNRERIFKELLIKYWNVSNRIFRSSALTFEVFIRVSNFHHLLQFGFSVLKLDFSALTTSNNRFCSVSLLLLWNSFSLNAGNCVNIEAMFPFQFGCAMQHNPCIHVVIRTRGNKR